jgi:hypothetical protein
MRIRTRIKATENDMVVLDTGAALRPALWSGPGG